FKVHVSERAQGRVEQIEMKEHVDALAATEDACHDSMQRESEDGSTRWIEGGSEEGEERWRDGGRVQQKDRKERLHKGILRREIGETLQRCGRWRKDR
ncbi:hypothetical protein KUCAC02_032790, partial [Chaenocephalus aceratus]